MLSHPQLISHLRRRWGSCGSRCWCRRGRVWALRHWRPWTGQSGTGPDHWRWCSEKKNSLLKISVYILLTWDVMFSPDRLWWLGSSSQSCQNLGGCSKYWSHFCKPKSLYLYSSSHFGQNIAPWECRGSWPRSWWSRCCWNLLWRHSPDSGCSKLRTHWHSCQSWSPLKKNGNILSFI